MRKKLFLMGGMLFIIIALIAVFLSVNKTATENGKVEISIEDIHGKTISIDNKKTTVLFFMAAWCISCADIERDLKEIAKDKNVQVITVDVDSQIDTKEDLAAFQKTYGGNWPHVLDTNLSLVKSFKVNSLDTVVILKNGKVVHKSIRPSLETMKDVIYSGS
ncbi:TlpA family protein disulfide reductase [Parageobacillus thermoglucosidasius]|jgi:thiol-disulfide isomerase/thioredoxin|uniref:TlpA family protein disulfide reductase n=1 Tax=Parageobacillus thermoglucosidasius TaxID=1426 RepID=UPI0027F8C9F9|nr:hypothetical protein PthstB1num2_37440 [Parageobacillus thermoglucosidasius]